MAVYKLITSTKKYYLNDNNIKYLPYVENMIRTLKNNNEPYNVIYIEQIREQEMNEIIKALTFICREATLDNFDITTIDKITIELLQTINFLGFIELYDKIFNVATYLLYNYVHFELSRLSDPISRDVVRKLYFAIIYIKHDEKNINDIECSACVFIDDDLQDEIIVKHNIVNTFSVDKEWLNRVLKDVNLNDIQINKKIFNRSGGINRYKVCLNLTQNGNSVKIIKGNNDMENVIHTINY